MKQVKDRNVQYPRRYTLTQVETGVVLGTFDFNPVTGEVIEAGTPINSELFKSIADSIEVNGTVIKLKDVDGNDLSVQVMYTINQEQTNSTTNIPSTKLLKDSSFARIYRNWSELGIDKDFSIDQLFNAMIDRSKALFAVSTYPTDFYGQLKLNLPVPFTGSTPFFVMEAYKNDTQRMVVRITTKAPNKTQLYAYEGFYYNIGATNVWTGWKQIKKEIDGYTCGGDDQDSIGKYFKWGTLTLASSTQTVDYHATFLVKNGVYGSILSKDGGLFNIFFRYANGAVLLEHSNINFLVKEEGLKPNNFIASVSGNVVTFYVKKISQYDRYHFTKLQGSIRTNIEDCFEIELNNATHEATDPTPDIVATCKEIITATDNQTISGVKEFTASPIVPTEPTLPNQAVPKAYVDNEIATVEATVGAYDLIIRGQTQFNQFVADCNSGNLTAKSVAIIGGGGSGTNGVYELSTQDNSGIKLPSTLYILHGFNKAEIKITNFKYNSITAKGGVWYETKKTTAEYEIRNLKVDITNDSGNAYAFLNCANLTNCEGIGTGGGVGFYRCTNLVNCIGTGTGSGAVFGFFICKNLVNCVGMATSGTAGCGFSDCTDLTNCIGSGIGIVDGEGYGFYDCTTASNCKYMSSTTGMWGGVNKNIDINTCRKTPVAVTSGELTTLNT